MNSVVLSFGRIITMHVPGMTKNIHEHLYTYELSYLHSCIKKEKHL